MSLKLRPYGAIQISLLLLLLLFFLAHQHKAAGRKTRLDIQNSGCNGSLLCYHGVVLLLLSLLFRGRGMARITGQETVQNNDCVPA